jgi:hypothetical protein
MVFAGRVFGDLAIILGSLPPLPVGDGFLQPFYGIPGAAKAKVHSQFSRWQGHIPEGFTRLLGTLWPRALFIYIACVHFELLLGHTFNEFMLQASAVYLPTTIFLLILSICSAFAHYALNKTLR